MKPDWNLIKKNFVETGKLVKESAKELLKVIDTKTVTTPEERLQEVRRKISENPNMSQAEIDELLKEVFNKPSGGFDELKEEALKGFEELKEKTKDLLSNDVMNSIKERIDNIIHDKDVEQLREVLNMESSLNDICDATKEFTKSVSRRLMDNVNKFFGKE